MTRLRKANRNRRWEQRKNEKRIAILEHSLSEYEDFANGLAATILRERREAADRAQEIANQLMKSQHLNQILNKMAYEFAQADKRNIQKWMEENRDFCYKRGILSIEDAEHYLQYNRKQLAARSQGARFKYVSDVERNFNTLTLHFPALTYSIMVDD
jgi:hypothetical protein